MGERVVWEWARVGCLGCVRGTGVTDSEEASEDVLRQTKLSFGRMVAQLFVC